MHPSRVWLGSILLAAGSLLAACGDGGGDSPGEVLSATPPATVQSVGGIYTGTVSSSQRNDTFTVLGAAPENGQGNAQLVEPATGWQYTLRLAPRDDNGVDGTIFVYNATGAYVGQGPFSGTFVSRSRLVGSFTTGSGDRGALSLAYDARYTAPTGLPAIAGDYRWTSVRNSQPARVNVSAGGGFNGQTETGCDFNGTLSGLDARYNLYSLALRTGASGCMTLGQNVSLTGLAFYTPASADGRTPASLTAIASNATGGFFARYDRTSP